MRNQDTISALDQIEAPAIELAPGIYDIAPEREEVESFTSPYLAKPVKGKGDSNNA
ncbi:hypothetical protein [Sphingobacterium corticibacter]|uniref:hypothetical protein n=1 Tax=Sphingobacterium corticibacter TaxID=2171749 RepID=UPI0013FD487D|nr:hypothetical protein [Sphingobacterium corticibacter]